MVFCDWLSCYQIHPAGGLPILNGGLVIAVDQDGTVDWTTQKKIDHVGSFDTKLRFMCDGTRIVFEGNIGRYGRPDNVFGFSVLDCIAKASDFLESFGLPRFTQINNNAPSARTDNFIKTGCVITRVDLTQNYALGSMENAMRLVHYMAGQAGAGREGRYMMPKSYGQSGVSWNEGSKHWYAKLYLKGLEMEKHASVAVTDWVKSVGMARHEISLKSRYLLRHGLQDLRAWLSREGEKMENIIYGKFADVFERNTVQSDPYADLPPKLRRLAISWRDGEDIWNGPESRMTKYRYRKALLPFGIDIKFACDVSRLLMRVEVIRMEPLAAPDWYWQEQTALKAA